MKADSLHLAAEVFPELRQDDVGPEVSVRCPFHGDEHASASYNIQKHVFFCHACEERGTLQQIRRRLGRRVRPGRAAARRALPPHEAELIKGPFNVPARTLRSHGFHEHAARVAGIRLRKRDGALIWPIRNSRGELVAMKVRSPGDRVKSRSHGKPSSALIGSDRLVRSSAEAPVLVTAGEKDLTIALHLLEPSDVVVVGSACGEGAWPGAYTKILENRDVVLAYDIDEAGRTGAEKAAGRLRATARSVRILSLPGLDGSKTEKDVADLQTKHGVDKARRLLTEAVEKILRDAPEADDERLVEKDGRYHSPSGRGADLAPVSSFVLELIEVIRTSDRGDIFRVRLRSIHRDEGILDLTPDAFESPSSFRAHINRVAGATWTGTTNALAALKESLARQSGGRRRSAVSQLGRHGDLFVFGRDLIVDHRGPVESPDLVFVPTPAMTAVAARVRARWGSEDGVKTMLEAVIPSLMRVHARATAGVLVGFLHASFFRPWLIREARLGHFPMLSITGEQGAGKTTLLRLLSCLGGFDGTEFESRSTAFSLIALVSSTNALLIVLDEYRPGDRSKRLEEILRGNYTSQRIVRGRADQGLNEYGNDAPIACGGEVSFDDAALNDRTLPIRLRKAHLVEQPETTVALRNIEEQDLSTYAPRFASWSLGADPDALLAAARRDVDKVLDEGSDSLLRVKDNLLVLAFGHRAFESFAQAMGVEIELDLPLEAALREPLMLLEENSGSQRGGLDRFLQTLATMAVIGRIERGKEVFVQEGELRVHLPSAFARYREHLRQQGADDDVLTENELRRRIREMYGAGESYVKDPKATSRHFSMTGGRQLRRSSYAFDLDKAERLGLDLGALRQLASP